MAKWKGYWTGLFALFWTLQIFGQKPYTAEYWEENWRDWPRPRFDNRIDSFAAVESIILREFFNSNSNSSGELYRHYVRFQYPTFQSLQENASAVFQLPNYEYLDDIDFRIWSEDLLIYEARAAATREYYLDTLGADPITNKMFAFRLNFPDLKPGCMVEVMITCKGVPLPYRLSFEQNFPIIESSQRIKILSAYPLRYKADSLVEVSKERLWDYDLYKFERKDIPAFPLESSLSTAAADLPGVWLDWKDQIFYYDRDESDDWEDLLPYLFYEGDLRDFVVYRNSLAEDFGKQQFFSSWIRPVRYFHRRAESLANNDAYAEGKWRLSKAYAERWIKVEEALNRIILDNEVRDFETAMAIVLAAQKKAIKSQLTDLPIEPPIFTEYGLLCSHLEKLFFYFRYEYRLALFSPARLGQPPQDFASPWTAVARGMLFRKSPEDDWSFIIPGPYMSQFYGINELPPDLDAGWVQSFKRKDTMAQVLSLPATNIKGHGFRHVYHLQERQEQEKWLVKDSLQFKGAFRSVLGSGYLTNDSVKDQLSYTNHQLLYQFEKNAKPQIGASKTYDIKDTLSLLLPLKEAQSFQAVPSPRRSFAIPMPFEAEWNYYFKVNDSLELSLPLPQLIENPVFKWSWTWKRQEDYWILKAKLEIKKAFITREEGQHILSLQTFLDSQAQLKIWKK